MSDEPAGHLVVDGRPVPFREGDSIAVALVRAGEPPATGGTLCLAGDCPNCLCVVDGVAYVRSCQEPARAGRVVVRHPPDANPPLPVVDVRDVTRPPVEPEIPLRRLRTDLAVVGGGDAGRAAAGAAVAAGREVVVLDAADGIEVMGVYPGPAIVAREPAGMLHVMAAEVVVATGAAELQPVCPGNELDGILTAGAAETLAAAGVDLGSAVAIGTPPRGVVATAVPGRLVRFEPSPSRPGRVGAVVTADEAGRETRTPCDTAIVGLGRAPRDVLARMAAGPGVAAAGAAAEAHPLPPAPVAGVVCRCMGTTVEDLAGAWERGFTELELMKRTSRAALGPCQGGACLPHVRAWIAERTGTVPAPFTARPASRQITIAEAAADTTIDAFRRTALHEEHLAAGARMDRFGGWWRPWHYGDAVAEYWAVRTAVSLGDVSTLGKVVVSGPDVVEALERLYPCHVADIKPGRSRYALLLNERGHLMDDGMILRDAEDRFTLSFTSGGAANAEMWFRDWIETWGLRVHVMDRTASLGAINVTGPLASTLLRRAGLADPPRMLGHVRADVAGIPCHVMRLSFTGEASFELHHPIDRSVELWRALSELGADLGIRPHGLQALFGLRLEKGHVIVGMDTELDTTPRRLGMDWAVRMEKPRFIGRAALERTAKLPDERRWFGFEMAGEAPVEGTPIRHRGEIVGNVTGSWTSPLLGRAVMLGWLRRGEPWPETVEIDGRAATRVPTPFHDPEGVRARA
ncbi:MAG: sarcosine oxidase alpha subunit [Chloroflexota bacterium]